MIVRFNRFGQLDPAESAATTSVVAQGQPSALMFFFVAVAAGVTVYLITRSLDRRRKS